MANRTELVQLPVPLPATGGRKHPSSLPAPSLQPPRPDGGNPGRPLVQLEKLRQARRRAKGSWRAVRAAPSGRLAEASLSRLPKLRSQPDRVGAGFATNCAEDAQAFDTRDLEYFTYPSSSHPGRRQLRTGCADQARQPGSQRILRARSVPDGSFTSRVMFTPSRAVAERACVYLNGGSGAIQDATGDTLLPLPLPPGTRCRSSVSSIAGVVVDGPSCARTRDTLLTWRREGFQPTTGPPRYDCVASPFDDRGRRSHDCRRTGKPSWRLSLSLSRKRKRPD